MRFRRPASILIAIAFSITLPAAARAATINFGALQTLGTPVGVLGGLNSFGSSLSFGGFDFSTNNVSSYGLSVWAAANPNHAVGGAAATSLFEYAATFQISFQRTGGGVFDLQGIDLANFGANMGNFPPTFGVTFTGTLANNSTVTQTFQVANSGPIGASPILQSFVFSGFNNLVKVDVTQGTYIFGDAFQFNNLVVQTPTPGPTAAVPEPVTLLWVGTGLGLLAARLRRKPGRLDCDIEIDR
jgi:hypothetical protein